MARSCRKLKHYWLVSDAATEAKQCGVDKGYVVHLLESMGAVYVPKAVDHRLNSLNRFE